MIEAALQMKAGGGLLSIVAQDIVLGIKQSELPARLRQQRLHESSNQFFGLLKENPMPFLEIVTRFEKD